MKTILLPFTAIFALTTATAQELSADYAAVNINQPVHVSNLQYLPGQLTTFSATLNISDAVTLQWSTPSEKNVSHYEIERSLDGRHFEKAALVFAFGNTNEVSNYTFTDKKITSRKAKTIHYRILSVISDGTAVVSAVKTVSTGIAGNEMTVVTYPNPAGNDLNIETPAKWQGKKVVYELFDNKGQLAKTSTFKRSAQSEAMDIASLTPGYYILKASCNGETAQQKIVKR